jgi:hypothetical protein
MVLMTIFIPMKEGKYNGENYIMSCISYFSANIFPIHILIKINKRLLRKSTSMIRTLCKVVNIGLMYTKIKFTDSFQYIPIIPYFMKIS